MMSALRPAGLVLVLITAVIATPVAAAAPTSPAAIRAGLETTLAALESDGDWEAAEARLSGLLDAALACAAADEDAKLFRDVALLLRQVRQLRDVESPLRSELLRFVRAGDDVGSTLAFLVRPGENPAAIYAVLDRLRRQRGAKLEQYANLVAAICVVHDQPLRRRVNENVARAPDAVTIFDYYVHHEKRMLFGVRDVPAELLVYVVDTTAGIDEMQWALRRYAGDPAVGRRFFDVEYDYEHAYEGKPKKATRMGWSLPNILRYGGVCADQAYFAMSVGKAIGVPTAYSRGASAEVSHAWVGFLQADSRRAWWNFDIGRYDAYRGVMGQVVDPQIGRAVPDSHVSLLSELAATSPADRQVAAALTDAAARLREMLAAGETLPPAAGDGPPPRDVSLESVLGLIEHALRRSPGYAPAWRIVAELAEDGRLTLEHRRRWADVLHRLCGERYPDFYLAVLGPMISSLEDVQAQNDLWNKAFALFRTRHDLAAAVRMAQARMWEQAGDRSSAGRCYEDVIRRYANAGPFVLRALVEAERLLRETGRGNRVLALYRRAFSQLRRPDFAGPFYRQSNFYRVGKLYADRLREAGRHHEAAAILTRIRPNDRAR